MIMYYQVKVTINDKVKLFDAIRECFKNNPGESFKLVVSENGDERFILTPNNTNNYGKMVVSQ